MSSSCACSASVTAPRSKSTCPPSPDSIAQQRRIHKQAGADASQFTALLGAVTAHNPRGTYWHQASDRTSAKKGGVDVKHGSYARYLAKRTGQLYKTQATESPAAKHGGKRRRVGLASLGPNGTC